jgi:beta-xylosidase
LPAFDGGADAMQLLTRVDEQHGNAAKGWCDMGCPRTPDEKQMEILQRLSAPETVSTRLKSEKGFYETEICLQQNMVEELELTPCSAPSQPYDGFEPEYGFGLQIGE